MWQWPRRVPLLIPEEHANSINRARLVCNLFNMRGWCKKGLKCPGLHKRYDGSFENGTRLPHLSATVNEQGKAQFQIRPPMTEALNSWSSAESEESENPKPKAVLGSKMINDRLVWIQINPGHLVPPDWEDGAAARSCGCIMVRNTEDTEKQTWRYGVGEQGAPRV